MHLALRERSDVDHRAGHEPFRVRRRCAELDLLVLVALVLAAHENVRPDLDAGGAGRLRGKRAGGGEEENSDGNGERLSGHGAPFAVGSTAIVAE